MKTFTITSRSAESGLAVETAPFPHVAIGEEGRGRKLVRVPLGAKDFPRDQEVDRADDLAVIQTAKGTLLLVKEDRHDPRVILHLAIGGGFRGRVTWRVWREAGVPCPNRGRHAGSSWDGVSEDGVCVKCGTRIGDDKYHPDAGMWSWPLLDQTACAPVEATGGNDAIRIVAHGWRAEGIAGRAGNHDEYLVIARPGALLRCFRAGRTYGGPDYLYVRVADDGKSVQVGDKDHVLPPDAETNGDRL